MGAVASKRRRRAGGEGAHQHDPPTLVVGLGDAILDLILVAVPHERLLDLGIERGGCVQVPSAQIDSLLDALAPGGGGNDGTRHAKRPEGLPGGSAANVIKGLAGLARATGASDSLQCRFAGMVARDVAGERYASALAAEGVEPLLLVAGAEDAGDEKTDDVDAASTARCLCLITPDGERTMRTCLGAAARLRSAEAQLAPRRWLELSSTNGAKQPPQQPRLLVHLEGYALYRPELAAGALRAARAKNGAASLDLASFELVRARRAPLLGLLREGLVDCLFCNEDEACALAEAAGLMVGGKKEGGREDDADDRRARAAAAEEAAEAAAAAAAAGATDNPLPSMSPAAAAAQRYLVEKGAGLCVVSLGARGCSALARSGGGNDRRRGAGNATKTSAPLTLERAGARACSLRSPLIDTVGAGDTFTAGFLFAWLRGASLAGCCALACAAGAEVVQVSGASLGAEGWARAWEAGGGVAGAKALVVADGAGEARAAAVAAVGGGAVAVAAA
jgi:sugar/nucleoside kinase (ribokinase family)